MKPTDFTGYDMNFSLIDLGFWKQDDTLLDPFKA